MGTTLGSVGGFVIGNEEISSHQCLSSFGYVFSASGPPFQVECALLSVKKLSYDLTKGLLRKTRKFNSLLK
eukprot:UN27296